MTGRNFTVSLKPAWDQAKIGLFLNEIKGVAIGYIINHDKDTNENGEVIENHTHVLIEYSTPRKISTIANLFGVEPNFVVIVKNKKAMLRYLTHLDDTSKYQYEPEQVYTNNEVGYTNAVLGGNMSDKEIADILARGKGMDLLGVVPAHKIRTIQSIITGQTQSMIINQLAHVNEKLDKMNNFIDKVDDLATQMTATIGVTAVQMVNAFQQIADEAKLARQAIQKRG